MVKILSNQDFVNSSRIVNHPAPQSPGDLVRKQELDNAIAELSGISVQIPTDLDASSNPDFPVSEPGQSYFVTVAGTVGGIPVSIGDQLICKNPSGSSGGGAAVTSDFFIVEGNKEAATETVSGLVRLATQTEVNEGSGAGAVTPVTLNSRLNTAFNSRRYSATIGDNSSTNFIINHGLNDPAVIVQLHETASPKTEVKADVSWIDANNIAIATINPLTTNEITVIVKS